MLLVISDANILIDIEDGNLTSVIFRLPYEIAVPDILFELELRFLRTLINYLREKKRLPPLNSPLTNLKGDFEGQCDSLADILEESCSLKLQPS